MSLAESLKLKSLSLITGNKAIKAPSPGDVVHRVFTGKKGEKEHFFTITAPEGLNFKEQVQHIETHYTQKLRSLNLASNTAVFRRIFLSDAHNQADAVRRSATICGTVEHPVAVSILQQSPIPYAKIALLSYHIESEKPLIRRRISSRHVLIRKNGLGHLWSTGLCSQDIDTTFSPARQTRNAFKELIAALSAEKGNLADNCVRTWIYLRDIDTCYQSMVKERRELFLRHGLTEDTHFIASTGIQGSNAHLHDLVHMDAYSILGLDPKQISYLNDFDKLCAAKSYQVTFERGTRIAYEDRSHFLISGTASINNRGVCLYPDNVLKQLDRTLENIDSLLQAGKASLADMMYLIIYLRDPADSSAVRTRLSQLLPAVPTIIVQGSVCRPEWLIEIEGIAIAADHQPSCPPF
jgi:enamine deaminase RidA (YjgF/YER057c/UK114 family)